MKIEEINFQDITNEDFMSNYWHKKPVLLKNAFPNLESPIDGNELAGIAMEDEAASRIVAINDGEVDVLHGPFKEEDFGEYAGKSYCLLVQEVETFVPGVLDIKRAFSFLPDWRKDDVMVSYASDGGTVGPHTDFFDVFLIQGQGKRKWEIGKKLEHEPEYYPDLPIRIMRDFEVDQTFTLEQGDALYVPPLVPHNGTAIGDSITISMGFRLPSVSEIASEYLSHIKNTTHDSQRLLESKPDSKNPGEISKAAIAEVRKIIESFPTDDDSIAHWFGKLVTNPVRSESDNELTDLISSTDGEASKKNLEENLKKHGTVYWNESARFSYYVVETGIKVFVDGEVVELGLDAIEGIKALSINRKMTFADYEKEPSMGVKYLAGSLFELNLLYTEA
ncbi:cupin domain-containing protein [bacterium]|nr:cupin domain-containing protein [bacterium]